MENKKPKNFARKILGKILQDFVGFTFGYRNLWVQSKFYFFIFILNLVLSSPKFKVLTKIPLKH